MSWVNSTPAVVDGKAVYATSDTSLFRTVDAATGKELLKESTTAYVWSSPSIAAGVAYYGANNGTFEARDVNSGELLWSFQTETSKRNAGWVLTSERRFNDPWLFNSGWREAPILAADREFRIGAFFSSALVVNGVVYVGSTDGYLYALE
jgi:outer membrane protein assembly factor BamB